MLHALRVRLGGFGLLTLGSILLLALGVWLGGGAVAAGLLLGFGAGAGLVLRGLPGLALGLDLFARLVACFALTLLLSFGGALFGFGVAAAGAGAGLIGLLAAAFLAAAGLLAGGVALRVGLFAVDAGGRGLLVLGLFALLFLRGLVPLLVLLGGRRLVVVGGFLSVAGGALLAFGVASGSFGLFAGLVGVRLLIGLLAGGLGLLPFAVARLLLLLAGLAQLFVVGRLLRGSLARLLLTRFLLTRLLLTRLLLARLLLARFLFTRLLFA